MTTECKFPFNSEYTESDDIRYCEEKLNNLPYINEIRDFVSTGNVEFVNRHICFLEDLNVLLQSIVYVGLDNYDPILLEFFWNDARSTFTTSSQLLEPIKKKFKCDKISFIWKSEIENYYFVKQTLCQPKKQYLAMAINQTKCDCSEAASRGNLRLLKWLRSKDEDWDEDTCAYAAKNGHLEVLKWAHEHNCFSDERVCTYAALYGHLEVLKWAHEHNFPWDAQTCAYAAHNGHLEILKWLREHGCSWDIWTCHNSTLGGHLEVLKWLRDHGCPWDEYTCIYAASKGHLEVLKWARQQGCPWSKSTCQRAARNGHLEALEWAREHEECPG